MTRNIIQEFIDVVDGMKHEYETSKAPKFIRKIKYNKRRKYILNLINTITDGRTKVSSRVVCNYAYILATTNPPLGKYKNCIKAVTVNDVTGTSIFETSISASDTVITAVYPTTDDGSKCSIEYTYASSGKTLFSFVEDDKKSIIYFGVYDEDGKSEDDYLDLAAIFAKEASAKTIIFDINSYLNDLLNERGKI